MSATRHKGLVHQFFHAWQTGHFDDLLTPDFYLHGSLVANGTSFQAETAAWRIAFPDGRFLTNIIVAEEERVLTHWTFSGTHLGVWQGIQPSSKEVTFSGATAFAIENDQIVEAWQIVDRMPLFHQLGLATIYPFPNTAANPVSLPDYLPESLRLKDDGFAFNIQNPDDDCTVLSMPSLRIDDEAIPLAHITMITMNGGFRQATAVSANSALVFPANTTLRFQVVKHRLATGPHDIEVVLELAETAVPHTITATDIIPDTARQ